MPSINRESTGKNANYFVVVVSAACFKTLEQAFKLTPKCSMHVKWTPQRQPPIGSINYSEITPSNCFDQLTEMYCVVIKLTSKSFKRLLRFRANSCSKHVIHITMHWTGPNLISKYWLRINAEVVVEFFLVVLVFNSFWNKNSMISSSFRLGFARIHAQLGACEYRLLSLFVDTKFGIVNPYIYGYILIYDYHLISCSICYFRVYSHDENESVWTLIKCWWFDEHIV